MDRVYITTQHLRGERGGPHDEGCAQNGMSDRSDRLLEALGLTDAADARPSLPPAEAISPPKPVHFRRASARGSGMATVAFSRLVPASAMDDRSGLARLRRHLASTGGQGSGPGSQSKPDRGAADLAPASSAD